jgi:hypothetical protein
MIFTGFSSRISITSLFPEKAAACASAVRDRDDDFGSRNPPRRDWFVIRPPARLPFALSRWSVLTVLADEALPFFPIDFEGNHPLEVRFASLAKIPFVIAVSFFAAIPQTTKCMPIVIVCQLKVQSPIGTVKRKPFNHHGHVEVSWL